MQEEDKKAKLKNLFKQSAVQPETISKPLPVLANKLVINGGTHHYAAAQARTKLVVVMPPGAVIAKAQKADLVERRDRWVALHNAIKTRQITRADARKALNARANVTAHRLIPAVRYADLVRWLEGKIEALRQVEHRLAARATRNLALLEPVVTNLREANLESDLTPADQSHPPPTTSRSVAPVPGHS